ncbi:MAG: hypothetical protein MUC43_12215 [Pirellula sp.]|nr:hypothetical protein [Pirellula sp.]
MYRYLFLIGLLLSLAGCGGVTVTKNPEQTEVNFNVTTKGQPVDDVKLVMLAIDDKGGGQAEGTVAKGKAKLTMYPGKYTYYVESGKTSTSFAKIPAAYHQGAMDRTIEVQAGSEIELKLD